ncbi:hypothetical protein [Bradyrhizobium sp. C9]|uniref:hypothetical protein n=1 Tax=Bradyrhizobium sp. C9 TaxID=142585 RepID=UPI00130407B8|nr:hypothetical protein [Bradyrhizobium sp. C9]
MQQDSPGRLKAGTRRKIRIGRICEPAALKQISMAMPESTVQNGFHLALERCWVNGRQIENFLHGSNPHDAEALKPACTASDKSLRQPPGLGHFALLAQQPNFLQGRYLPRISI